MIENSSRMVFSFIENMKRYYKQKPVDLFKVCYIGQWKVAPDFIVNQCKRIYNELENSYYTYADMFLYMAYNDLMGGPAIKLYDINKENIKKVNKIFSDSRVKADMDKLKAIAKKSDIKSMKEYYELDDCGDNILRNLVMENHISPLTYIKYIRKHLTSVSEFIMLSNTELKMFHKKLNRIKRQFSSIKGALNGREV